DGGLVNQIPRQGPFVSLPLTRYNDRAILEPALANGSSANLPTRLAEESPLVSNEGASQSLQVDDSLERLGRRREHRGRAGDHSWVGLLVLGECLGQVAGRGQTTEQTCHHPHRDGTEVNSSKHRDLSCSGLLAVRACLALVCAPPKGAKTAREATVAGKAILSCR